MTDKRISDLSTASALTGSELVELVQSGNNVRSTAQGIANLAPAGFNIPYTLNDGTNTFLFNNSSHQWQLKNTVNSNSRAGELTLQNNGSAQLSGKAGVTCIADLDGALVILQGGDQTGSHDYGEVLVYGPGSSNGIIDMIGHGGTGNRNAEIYIQGNDIANIGGTESGMVQISFHNATTKTIAIDARMVDATAATKLGFFATTPVIQPQTTGTTSGFTAGAGTAMNSASTSTGGTGTAAYTFGDVVLALKQLGLMKS